jgi:hypothetical protein
MRKISCEMVSRISQLFFNSDFAKETRDDKKRNRRFTRRETFTDMLKLINENKQKIFSNQESIEEKSD